jgi:beta-glucosidase
MQQRSQIEYAAMVAITAIVFAWLPGSASGSSQAGDRIDTLIHSMTLEEKISMLHGSIDPDPATGLHSAGYVAGVPRLGIPPLRLTDGPAGIRVSIPATALPAPIGLAASFDVGLAHRYGKTIGLDGRARNQNVLLAPMVNIVRVPQGGRNFETLGEDPLLASKIVAAEIQGIQSAGMMATVKHFIANNQENDRFTIDARVGERSLREIYLPAFDAAIAAGSASVMCAYNRVNERPSCDSDFLLNTVLRDEYHFEGFVMTDWWASHTLSAIDNGLNIVMPGFDFPKFPVKNYFGEPLLQAVHDGKVPESAVENALRPILRQMQRFGLLDDPKVALPNVDPDSQAAVAEFAAERSAVLLKNKNSALPLDPDRITSVLVLGPTAQIPLIGGGGSSRVMPIRRGSVVDAMELALGDRTDLKYLTGIDLDGAPIPAPALRRAGDADQPGLQRSNDDDGETFTDATIDFVGANALPFGTRWTWTGKLKAPSTGDYELKMQSAHGTAELLIDGERVASTGGILSNTTSLLPTHDGLKNSTGSVALTAGRDYTLKVAADGKPNLFEPNEGNEPLQVRLAWVTPEARQANFEASVDAASRADAVVVFAYVEGTEGTDRNSLALPGYQDAFIQRIAKASKSNVIVVLNVGAPVFMPWIDEVDAVLLTWYPGQDGDRATASLLLGGSNPGGKLPVTFPARLADLPTNSPDQYPGVDGHEDYSEGIFVGYRWYDLKGLNPLFPFGHGLSYTRFGYSDLTSDFDGDELTVEFTLKNTGPVPGSEVPQVYLGPPANPHVKMEDRKLVAFDRIELRPGESRRVILSAPSRLASFWSTDAHHWQLATGTRRVFVGSSSRDIRLTGEVTVIGH